MQYAVDFKEEHWCEGQCLVKSFEPPLLIVRFSCCDRDGDSNHSTLHIQVHYACCKTQQTVYCGTGTR